MVEFVSLIDDSIKAIEGRDAMQLREISADALTEAAVEGHRELILIALVDYALSKIMSKIHYQAVEGKFYDTIISHFRAAREGPKEKTIENLEEVEDMVVKLDDKEGNFEENVMDKAKIKKASNLYEKGFSLRRASEMTGADPVKVLEFVGGSKIHEPQGFAGGGKNVERLKVAREAFGG